MVRGIREHPNPWLSDHVIVIVSRWLGWGVTLLLLFGEGRLFEFSSMLLVTGVGNLLISVFARRYVMLARRHWWLIGLDILYAAIVLLFSGGWNSWFALYAYSSLVLPALLFLWRGGVLAGLSFSAIQATVLLFDVPPSSMVSNGQVIQLGMMMLAPPIFSCAVAVLCVQQINARRRKSSQQRPLLGDLLGREVQSKAPSGARPNRLADLEMDHDSSDAPLIAAATKIRPAEQSVEDLRRILFSPFPSTDMELSAVIDLLSTRFSRHTGLHTHVSLLGRTRMVHLVIRQLLIRLAQEALMNIQQHAHSHAATITLRYDATSVVLMIQDYGVGLLDGTYERPGLHALRAMHYRLSELGGRLDVFETEGGGVTVRAILPIEQ